MTVGVAKQSGDVTMCGIVGYVGEREAQPILIDSLKRLEYRGYDSCGIAVMDKAIQVCKEVGRIEKLEEALSRNSSKIGIGHTRWATHGKPSSINAHPHTDCSGSIAVVHNGVIVNFQRLREQLTKEGHSFRSETDSEVIPHLIEKYYQGDLKEAVARALLDMEGSYAFIALHVGSNVLIAARNESPLVIGLGTRENFAASDVPAMLDYTNRVIYLEDGDISLIEAERVTIFNREGKVARREEQRIAWSVEEARKGGYEHFMLKEIHEQPKVIRDCLKEHLSVVETVVNQGIVQKGEWENILIVACGTSYHAALVGEYIIEKLAKIPVEVKLASEFNYGEMPLSKTWVIGITQSGETADTLKALRGGKRLGCQTLAITNVVGSSVTRIADQTYYIRAGPEISVAATKSFVAQLIALYLLALSAATVDIMTRENLVQELRLLPNKVQQILDEEEQIAQWGKYLSGYESIFFVARGISLPIALEGALKMKEIAYIHAEGYSAGELKHGPFALLTPDTPVIAIVPRDNSYEALLTNIKEIGARETPVICLAEEDDEEIEKYVSGTLRLPKVSPILSPIVNTITLQLLAYYAAKERGCPIDRPRNLAKSVTVE